MGLFSKLFASQKKTRKSRRSNRVVTFLTDAELAQLQGVAAEGGSSLSAAAHKILASSLSRRQKR